MTDTPAITALRQTRKDTLHQLGQMQKYLREAEDRVRYYQGRVDEHDRTLADIDRAIAALSYPE